MNDFNQSNQANLPGFEEYPDLKTSVMPDFNQLLTKKVETIKSEFDPHALMVKKKLVDSGESESLEPKREWPEKDIKALEDFCSSHGILGFNCGKMSPIAALAMLKQQLGIVDGPLEDRVPLGYKKINSKFNFNNSYIDMVKKKTVLHG